MQARLSKRGRFGAKTMSWLLFLYVMLSLVISGSAAIHAGLAAGVYAILTSGLVLIAAGGGKAMLFWGDIIQKIGGTLAAIFLVILAYWLSGGFSVGLFGYLLTGAEWGAIGFVIAFLWVNRRIAARVLS